MVRGIAIKDAQTFYALIVRLSQSNSMLEQVRVGHDTRHKRQRPLSRVAFPFAKKCWLATLDTLRNFFYAPTAEMKITFELLRQGALAG